jgi:nicotinamide mononucleotide transporter
VTPIEIAATLLGVANIVLIVRRSIWNYPFALAMVSLYAVIFFGAKLYSDAGLQVFFVVVNLYGWWAWSQNKANAGEIVVERLTASALTSWAAGSVGAILAWGTIMARLTDASFPYWDGSVAMLSVAAQILMTQRKLENWWWWIAVNTVSIPLYLVKGLTLTAGLYGLFLILAIWGLIEWRRVEAQPHEEHLPARP